eukprot:jgi/Chlat1/1051/Chrsp110S01533
MGDYSYGEELDAKYFDDVASNKRSYDSSNSDGNGQSINDPPSYKAISSNKYG